MGTWGYQPIENDAASEWLANEVEGPLLATIKQTLQGYLDQTEMDDVKTHEAETAAALLVDVTCDHARMKYIDLNSGWLAKQEDLWSLAVKVVKNIMQDDRWISNHNELQRKIAVLEGLLVDLQHSQEANG